LFLNANDLLGILNDRRRAIVELLVHTSALAEQLSTRS
jgi:phospholipid/cholesterol/gamma-HCH transport system substrate-binding protein